MLTFDKVFDKPSKIRVSDADFTVKGLKQSHLHSWFLLNIVGADDWSNHVVPDDGWAWREALNRLANKLLSSNSIETFHVVQYSLQHSHNMVRFKQKATRRASGEVVVGRSRGRARQDPESGPASRRKRRMRPGMSFSFVVSNC